MENAEIARLFSETADLMEIAAEDGFRIRSYRNAASTILGYPERVADIVADPERDVTEIPGVGKGLAAVLREVAERGSFERRDLLLAKYPPTALELLKIQGLGPKSIALLFEHYRVSTVDDLERICVEQKLRELPRMGAKLEEKVLRSIAQYRQSAGRFLLNFGYQTVNELTPWLAETPGVEKNHGSRKPSAGPRDAGRYRPVGHRTGRWGGSRPLRATSARHRSARQRRQQSQREVRSRRHSGGLARFAHGKLRRSAAILHRQQRTQCLVADARAENGPLAQ
jgi:DNA polymerase/3'-5' exonuclease PolX